VAYNSAGIAVVGAGATIRVGQTTITGNAVGWQVPSGSLLSYGNNRVDGNAGGEGAMPRVSTM